MTERTGSSGVRAYRVLLRAYPRSMRIAHGEEMVGLVRDRTVDGEPWWQLWPSLLHDTVRSATATRFEELMATYQALVIGALGAFAALAALSDGVRAALPILLTVALVVMALLRWQPPVGTTLRHRSWRRWAGTGVLLIVLGTGYHLAIDREATPAEWVVLFSGTIGGVFAVATGFVLLATRRTRAVTS